MKEVQGEDEVKERQINFKLVAQGRLLMDMTWNCSNCPQLKHNMQHLNTLESTELLEEEELSDEEGMADEQEDVSLYHVICVCTSVMSRLFRRHE